MSSVTSRSSIELSTCDSASLADYLLVDARSYAGEPAWLAQAEKFVQVYTEALVALRDRFGVQLDAKLVSQSFGLDELVDLASGRGGVGGWGGFEMTQEAAAIRKYLEGLPGFGWERSARRENTYELHGFTTMQIVRRATSLM
jgi:hypothetical protein